jgi:hypothetical protein
MHDAGLLLPYRITEELPVIELGRAIPSLIKSNFPIWGARYPGA